MAQTSPKKIAKVSSLKTVDKDTVQVEQLLSLWEKLGDMCEDALDEENWARLVRTGVERDKIIREMVDLENRIASGALDKLLG